MSHDTRKNLWILAILSALIPTYLVRFEVLGIPTTLWEILLYVTVIFFVIRRRLTWRTIAVDPTAWPLLLLFVASLGALAVSPDLRAAAGQWKALALDSILFYLLIRSQVTSVADWQILMGGYQVSAVIVALHALITGILGNLTVDGRAIGIYAADPGASPNYLALFLAPAAALSLGEAVAARPRLRWRLVAAGLVLLVAIILSGSRAGLLAVAGSLGLGGMWYLTTLWPRLTRTIWTFGLMLVVLILVVAAPSFLPDFSPEAPSGRIASSNNIRWEIWRTTMTTIIPRMSFFGVGWGNYQATFTEATKTWVNYPEFIAPYALHPHNFLLTALVTTGWLGLLGWLWIIGRSVKLALPMRRQLILPTLVLLVWFFHGLVDTTYFKNDLAPLSWLLLLPFLEKPSTSS